MRTDVRIFCLVTLTVALYGCAEAKVDSLPNANEIVALEQQMWDDWKNQRFSAIGDRMSADAVMLSADGITDRTGAVAAMTKAACQVENYSLEDPKVRILAPNVALIAYSAKSVQRCAGQATSESGHGAHSSLWVKQNGVWITMAHHENEMK